MTLLHRFGSIVRWIARRATAEQDLDDELQSLSTWLPPTRSATAQRLPTRVAGP